MTILRTPRKPCAAGGPQPSMPGRPVPSDNVYMDPALLWNYSFQRDFPLGLEPSLMSEPGAWRFAIGARSLPP